MEKEIKLKGLECLYDNNLTINDFSLKCFELGYLKQNEEKSDNFFLSGLINFFMNNKDKKIFYAKINSDTEELVGSGKLIGYCYNECFYMIVEGVSDKASYERIKNSTHHYFDGYSLGDGITIPIQSVISVELSPSKKYKDYSEYWKDQFEQILQKYLGKEVTYNYLTLTNTGVIVGYNLNRKFFIVTNIKGVVRERFFKDDNNVFMKGYKNNPIHAVSFETIIPKL